MIEVTRYVANDGKEFDKREECIEYENSIEIREMVKAISTFCTDTYCDDCPFHIYSNVSDTCMFTSHTPSEWKDYL